MNKMDSVLVTGCAGFIGYHLSQSLLKDGINVLGIDNLNDYYDINLKDNRLLNLIANKKVGLGHFFRCSSLAKEFSDFKIKFLCDEKKISPEKRR